MITKNGRFICDICGKFVSYVYYYSWTYFGGCLDTEPPDPNYAHVECWDAMGDREKQLTAHVSWVKPHLIDWRGKDETTD